MPQMTPYSSKHIGERGLGLSIPCCVLEGNIPCGMEVVAKQRDQYEPFVKALADRVQVSLPPWIPPADTVDDWQTSAWDDLFPSIRQTLNQVMHPQ